ncbi:MAG: TIGR00266 family protein [Proteobacteria bacterium]|nr:TIGR00266 family protein [Pseudomonadota bacterium]
MRHEIHNKPDFASLHVFMDKGDQIVTEAGAMMSMSTDLDLQTNMKGGVMGALKRAVGGESVFMNTYTAEKEEQRLDVAPASPGDILHLPMNDTTVMVQRGSYLCSTPDITIDTKFQGLKKTFLSGEGAFLLQAIGTGDLWLSSYGAIHQIDIDGEYIVDTGHIVAFDNTVEFDIKKVGGLKSLLFSGEGLVCEFSGRGRVWIQTRNSGALAAFLSPFRPVKSN